MSFPTIQLPTLTLPAFELANPQALLLLVLVPFFVLMTRFSRRRMRPKRERWALAVRLAVLTLLVLAAADPRVRAAADRLAVGFLVDVSDSVPPGARDDALTFVRQALEAAPAGDEAAVIAFGGDALVDRPIGPSRQLPTITSSPLRAATDIAAALRVGLGVLPTDRARRLVLLSDGNENHGRAADEARVAAAAGVPVDVVSLGDQRGPEVLVRSLEAPGAIREGDTFSLRLSIDATVETSARVHLLTDGRLDVGASATVQTVQLHPGPNQVVVPHDPLPSGFHSFRVQVEPGTDTIAENNESVAFTTVSGRPRVLLVEGFRGQGRFLADALKAGGIETSVAAPIALPTELGGLRGWDGVVLVNVPATVLSAAQMRALKSYVQTLGGGLTIVGGDKSFALGGYQRTPLEEMSPLTMQRRGARAQSSVALEIVVDTSGSMGDNVGGMTKMDLAKEAALGALDLLTQADQLGVIAFEDKPRTVVDLDVLTDGEKPRAAIKQMAPGGGTAIYPAIEAAYDVLARHEAKVKHIVVLTDGISPGGDYPGLTKRMRDANITLSTIGIGNDADFNLLQQLADMGAGRFYEGSDPFQVPQILVKETLEVARTAIVEEPFRPAAVGSSQILDGIDPRQLPVSRGYVSLTPKSAALVVLGTRQGDPLLAEWQYGLGQVVAWTSDADNRWSSDWVEWPEFSRFWSQVVKRTVPARVDQNVQTTVSVEGERATVQVEALNDDRSFRNFLRAGATLVAPDGKQSDLRLDQVGPGRYQGVTQLGPPGAYLVQAVLRQPTSDEVVANQATGFVTTSSAEYWQLRPNQVLLRGLARATGGGELARPADAFLHNLRAPGAGRELWPWLTAAAAALFLVDVAVRRLRVSTAAAERALAAARERLRPSRLPRPAVGSILTRAGGAGAGSPTATPAAARLLAAKRRGAAAAGVATARVSPRVSAEAPAAGGGATGSLAARLAAQRTLSAGAASAGGAVRVSRATAPTRATPAVAATKPGEGAAGGTGARLLAAKQRARGGR